MAKKKKSPQQYSIVRNYALVGAYLKGKRVAAKLTQRDLSEKLGYLSPQFISNFENGISLVPIQKIAVLQRLIGVNPPSFFEIA